MNLIIDRGNTSSKLALTEGNIIIQHLQSAELNTSVIEEFIFNYAEEVNQCLISNVSSDLGELSKFLRDRFQLHVLTSDSRLPFTNAYASPTTLGTDRMANAAGAIALFPNRNCLVIDAGTCLKFDFVNAAGTYLGGSISPGISLRFKAMNDYTSRLPLLSGGDFPASFLGTNTRESMGSGVFFGMLGEINEYIRRYQELYSELQVVITGGDSHYFVPALKSNIFASPDFTLIGLNKILELNV